MIINRDSPIPPHRQISDHLRQRITSGEIPPGMRIPSTFELEDQYQVARDTLRKAIKTLKDEGLIYSVPGLGIFVTEKEAD